MKITKVTVGVSEKRNHPLGEYANYSAHVAYEVEVDDESDDVTDVVDELLAKARIAAVGECDNWETRISVLEGIGSMGFHTGEDRNKYVAAIERSIATLPVDMQYDLLLSLRKAVKKHESSSSCEEDPW